MNHSANQILAKEERKLGDFELGLREMIETARTMSPSTALLRAQRDILEYQELNHSALKHYHAGDIGIRASHNPSYRAEIENYPDIALAAKQAISVGAPLSTADIAFTKKILENQDLRILQPRVMNEYAGRIIAITDTHLVQQTGSKTVVAHDISRLEELPSAKPLQGQLMKFNYGALTARSELIEINPARQEAIRISAENLAITSIKSPLHRQAFKNHVEKTISAAIDPQIVQKQQERQFGTRQLDPINR